MASRRTATVYFEDVLAKTDKAVLLRMPNGEEIWFPLSQCEDLEEAEKGDGPGEFDCPEWLADEKGVG